MPRSWCCDKCGGSGSIRAFGHIAGGVCFKCDGSGRLGYDPEPRGEVVRSSDDDRAEIERFMADEADGERRWAECVMAGEWN